MSEPTRCHDCLDEFGNAERFAVLKKMRDIDAPKDAIEPPSFFQSACYDAVVICRDCAGWYGDEVIAIPAPTGEPSTP